jgi:non-haem Fe2+, alpha-ketoglutarate-dependent halogenase
VPASLTQSQIEHYRREGYLAPLPAISGAQADAFRAELEAFEARYNQKATLAIRNKGYLKLTSLYRLIHDSCVLDAVESVLGPDILCWGASLFVKDPGDPAYVAWHQDSYYWGLDPADVCSAWIAFAPSNIENGAMEVIPGSHLWPAQPHVKSPAGSGNMLYTFEEMAVGVDETKAVPLLLEKGQMSLHHVKIAHGSKPNQSRARRYGYAIRYVAPHVKQAGWADYATLVRGKDRYGHFHADPVPQGDMDPKVLDFITDMHHRTVAVAKQRSGADSTPLTR